MLTCQYIIDSFRYFYEKLTFLAISYSFYSLSSTTLSVNNIIFISYLTLTIQTSQLSRCTFRKKRMKRGDRALQTLTYLITRKQNKSHLVQI